MRAISACAASIAALASIRLALAALSAASATYFDARRWSSISPVAKPLPNRASTRSSCCPANVRSLSRWAITACASASPVRLVAPELRRRQLRA